LGQPDHLAYTELVQSLAESSSREARAEQRRELARRVLASFVLTFVIARILVILIMAGKLPPELFFHVRGTHVHHLNYGIFLLTITGAILLFSRPEGKALSRVAAIYGIGLALTFDEFGMWLHLGGQYWQRASYDAVVTVGAVLALIAYGASIRRWRPHHIVTAIALIVALCVFGFALKKSLVWAQLRFGPELYHLETHGPS